MNKSLRDLVKGDRVTVVNTDSSNAVAPLAILVVDHVGARELRTLPRSPGQEPERWLLKTGHKPGTYSGFRASWVRPTEDGDEDAVLYAAEHAAVREAERRLSVAMGRREAAQQALAERIVEEQAASNALALAMSALKNAQGGTPS